MATALFVPEHFARLLAYERWASAAAADSLRTARPAAPEAAAALDRARGIFGHIQSARHLWLSRLGAVPPRPWVKFPDAPLEAIAADAASLDRLWGDYLSSLTEADLHRVVSYSSTEGHPYTTPVRDILTHVFHHSTYHRGQIAMLVRQAGGEPAVTDLIVWARREQ